MYEWINKKRADRFVFVSTFMDSVNGLLLSHHFAFDVQAYNFLLGIASDGDGFSEMSRESAFAIVSYNNLTGFAWFDGFSWIIGYGTSARGNSLMDNQQLVACIGKCECTSYL